MDISDHLKDPRTSYFANEYLKLEKEKESLEKVEDVDMKELISEEIEGINKKMEELLKTIEEVTKEEDGEVNKIIVEIRAGAGGDEASLFARELAGMYEKYCDKKGFNFIRLSESLNDVGGYKEVSFEIGGVGIFDLLRFEMGVHRVQRIPATEKKGRIHTSTVSVAVLPVKKRKDVDIKAGDLKVEFSRSGGSGGQNVNKVETAVRLVHIPTGLEVRCTAESNQQKNRKKAMDILAMKLDEHVNQKNDEVYGEMRRNQIGTGDRSEKIRTYNFPQDRVTDHRLTGSFSGVDKILSGDIDKLINTLSEEVA